MSAIAEDACPSADWIAKSLVSSGYKADFSLESLREIDRFFDEHSEDGRPKPNGLLSQQLGVRIFAIGAYVGEVIRRAAGGEWHGDDADPKAEISIELRLPNEITVWPVQRVMKRLTNGSEDAIFPYGAIVVTEATRSTPK